MLQWLSEKLFHEDKGLAPAEVEPDVGAAALLIEAAHRDGNYTEVEKDLATSAVMKLFHLNKTGAIDLLKHAWAAQKDAPHAMRFAVAAKKLDADKREQLVTRIWAVIDSDREALITESMLVSSVIDVLGISPERAKALRLPAQTMAR